MNVGEILVKLGVDSSGLDADMKTATDTMSNSVSSAVKGMSDQLKAAGAAFTAVGVAGLSTISSSKEMNAQLGATGITINKTAAEMRDLALGITNVTFPLESVSATLDILTRAGVDNVEQLGKSANAFDALADATGSSAEVVAATLIPAYKLFGEEIPTTAEEMDKFTWLVKNTTVDLNDFGGMLVYLAPQMDKLNITMDDSVAIMAALEDRGISGSAATRTFRSAVTEAATEGVSLNEVLGISQTEIDGYRNQMDTATGSTQAYADQLNTQYSLMDEVKQKFSEASLVVGSFLEPLELVFGAMSAAGPVLLFLSTSIGQKTIALVAAKAAWIAHTAATVAASAASKAAAAAQWLLNAALSANPIGLVVIAIAALVAAFVTLWNNVEGFRNFFIQAWENIKNFMGGIGDAIRTLFTNIGEFIKAPIKSAIDFVTGLVNGAIDMINGLINLINKIPGVDIPNLDKIDQATDKINKYTESVYGMPTAEIAPTVLNEEALAVGVTKSDQERAMLKLYADGGPIVGPTLLSSLSTGKPYAIAGEAGPEWVGPAGGGGGHKTANIVVQLDGRTIAKALGQPLVDLIRVKTGIVSI
ncbi:MAG: phage tail tape measure protein [Dehalogenimonas sp.]|nr:phage tail tape measure protein [Dehalogenimonas sp.]